MGRAGGQKPGKEESQENKLIPAAAPPRIHNPHFYREKAASLASLVQFGLPGSNCLVPGRGSGWTELWQEPRILILSLVLFLVRSGFFFD